MEELLRSASLHRHPPSGSEAARRPRAVRRDHRAATGAEVTRSYLSALLLLLGAGALLWIGDALFPSSGFPWTLLSLLVVTAAASLCGAAPAVLVLVLAVVGGALLQPHLHLTLGRTPEPTWPMRLTRWGLFTACGGGIIWLTDQARRMRERAECGRGVVAALQTMILPERLVAAPGYDLGGVYHPARQEEAVGGDFYDFYPLGAGRYGLLIGDVMGKGKEAAAHTALLRYSVRALAGTGLGPAEVLDQVEALVERQAVDFGMASLFVATLDADSGALRYASAGHEPPLLARADAGADEALGPTGPVLGVRLGVAHEERVIMLGAGDALLLMTDGVTEARDGEGRFLDRDGAWRLFRAALHGSAAPGNTSAQASLASLARALSAYVGSNRRDDIAMLLLRRTQGPADIAGAGQDPSATGKVIGG